MAKKTGSRGDRTARRQVQRVAGRERIKSKKAAGKGFTAARRAGLGRRSAQSAALTSLAGGGH